MDNPPAHLPRWIKVKIQFFFWPTISIWKQIDEQKKKNSYRSRRLIFAGGNIVFSFIQFYVFRGSNGHKTWSDWYVFYLKAGSVFIHLREVYVLFIWRRLRILFIWRKIEVFFFHLKEDSSFFHLKENWDCFHVKKQIDLFYL